MPDAYYPDIGAGQGRAAPDKDVGASSALLPKSLVGGKELKPGETITLKVVKTYEDEIEVEYQKEKETEEPETPGAPMTADEEIDQLAQEREE
jgi:hypothetical protein